MTKLRSLFLGAGLALVSIGLAHADSSVAGAWKFTVGVNGTPCTLTLTPDASGAAGTVAAGADCAGGLNAVTTWSAVNNNIQLFSGAGDLVASLKLKGDIYAGTRYSDGRKVAMSR